jgi:hypothetical protein
LLASAWRGRLRDLRKKNLSVSVERHITVIIYAQNELETLIELVKALQNQEYSSENYSINVVLDNPSANTEKVLELVKGIKIWKISTKDAKVGMYPSVSWFLDKIKADYTNAYVVLSAKNLIKPNFLQRVNISLENAMVSQACLATKSPYSSIYNTLGYLMNRIENRIHNAGQYHIGLSSFISGTGLIMTQEFLERYPMQLGYGENEIDYNYEIFAENVKIGWAPEVIIYSYLANDVQDLAIMKAEEIVKRVNAILRNLKNIFKSPRSLHLTFYYLAPGRILQLIIVLILLMIGLYNPINIAGINAGLIIPLVLMVVALMTDFAGLIISKCNLQDYKIWFIGGLIYLKEVFFTFIYTAKLFNITTRHDKIVMEEPQQEKMEVHKTADYQEIDIQVSDGAKNLPCKLQLRCEGYDNQITFIFKDKQFTTKSYDSLDKAFEELNTKLESRNFKIVTCYNCGYFSYSNTSHQDSFGTAGHCFYNREGQQIHYDDVVKTWESCEYFTTAEQREEILKRWRASLGNEEQKIENGSF